MACRRVQVKGTGMSLLLLTTIVAAPATQAWATPKIGRNARTVVKRESLTSPIIHRSPTVETDSTAARRVECHRFRQVPVWQRTRTRQWYKVRPGLPGG